MNLGFKNKNSKTHLKIYKSKHPWLINEPKFIKMKQTEKQWER